MSKENPSFRKAILVDATDMPDELIAWCVEHEISTHYRGGTGTFHINETVEKDPDYYDKIVDWLVECGVNFNEFKDPDSDYLTYAINPT